MGAAVLGSSRIVLIHVSLDVMLYTAIRLVVVNVSLSAKAKDERKEPRRSSQNLLGFGCAAAGGFVEGAGRESMRHRGPRAAQFRTISRPSLIIHLCD